MRQRTYTWQQSCACAAAEPAPCLVLDPFAGAGTTGLVSASLGRDALLIELNPTYVNMAAKRIRDHAEKHKISCCVIAPEIVNPESPIKTLSQEETSMSQSQISFTVNLSPRTSPIAIQQLLDWVTRINNGETGDSIPDPKANGGSSWTAENAAKASSPKERALFKQILDTQQVSPAPVGEIEVDEEDGEEVSQPTTQPASALPPGVDGPAPKRKGGRPSKAVLEERARLAAEEAAKVNPALVPQQQQAAPQPGNGAALPPGVGGGFRPPGVGGGFRPPGVDVAMPQQPAMPAMPPQEEYSDGVVTKEDLRSCYAQAVGHDPKGVHTLMRAQVWSDHVGKPQWFTIENVQPIHYDRLYSELGSLIPAEA